VPLFKRIVWRVRRTGQGKLRATGRFSQPNVEVNANHGFGSA